MKRSLGTLHAFYSLKSLFKLSSHAILKPLCGHVKEFPLYYELIFIQNVSLVFGGMYCIQPKAHYCFVEKCQPSFLFVVGESISESTPFIEGPSDTSERYTGNLFRSTLLQENIMESMGPVLSFTLQIPQAAIRSSDPVAQPGNFKALWN